MSTEAMKQALEALEWQQQMLITAMQYSAAKGMTFLGHPPNPNDAITALRTAIEQAEKAEPVAYSIGRTLHWHEGRGVNDAQLYTPPAPAAPVQEECVVCGDKVRVIPRPLVGLTDEQINELRQQYGVTSDGRGIKEFTYVCDFVRAIEAKLGEKNAAQPAQEEIQRLTALVRAQQITIDKLEAAPVQEPMTDEQIKQAKPVCADFVSFRAGVRYAEARYKEKQP
jgi:hypothetical protein